MPKLKLEIDAVEIDPRLYQLIDTLTSLQQIPEFPFKHFQRLLRGLLSEVSMGFDSAAAAAGNLRVVCSVSGNLELVTAALVALQSYLHGSPRARVFGVETKR